MKMWKEKENERTKKKKRDTNAIERMVHITNDKKIAFVSALFATLTDYVLVLALSTVQYSIRNHNCIMNICINFILLHSNERNNDCTQLLLSALVWPCDVFRWTFCCGKRTNELTIVFDGWCCCFCILLLFARFVSAILFVQIYKFFFLGSFFICEYSSTW